MNPNPLRQIESLGQSIWLDYIRRDMIVDGRLRQWIEEDGLRGMTSNPAIFEKAITGSRDYDDDIQTMARAGKKPEEIYEALAIADVQRAADVFLPVYEKTDADDGYVSLEVNPHLARDTKATIDEARRLWNALRRPNVMIKVPATREGLPAISQLIAEGINVNVTLLFGLPRYRLVAESYLEGIEARVARNQPVARLASVASFFVSRIDTLIDPRLEEIVSRDVSESELARELRGQAAVSSAKVAYRIYKEIFGGERFRRSAERGARPQRLLWGSTSTKNPHYPDVKYVEALIGPETIDTLPLETFDAYRDHGRPRLRLEQDVDHAAWILGQLRALDIDLDLATQQLEDEGIDKFAQPFDHLLEAIDEVAHQLADRAE